VKHSALIPDGHPVTR